MPDIISATSDRETREIAGASRVFKHLTVYDRAELLKADRANKREAMVANLKLAEMDARTTYAELQQFDEETLKERHWIAFVNDVRSDGPIFRASLLKSYSPDEVEQVVKTMLPDLELKAKLCGLEIGKQPPAPTEGEPPVPTEGGLPTTTGASPLGIPTYGS